MPASIVAIIPTAKRAIRAASTPNLPLSGQDSGIQASRPPLRCVYPVYPDVRARGVVSLTAILGSDGAVRNVRVVSGNRALAAAAVRAVRQWRYRPYLKDGQPVATETNIVISFFSDDAISMSFPPGIPAIH
jgi:protein TonB